MKRLLLILPLLVLHSWQCPAQAKVAQASDTKPNVILIVTDDHGYHDLGVYGAKDIRTPHIDSLAQNGVRFTQGYVTAPLCGPSRAALLTGRYQTRIGFEVNSGPRPAANFGLPEEEKTLANYLKDAGYATGMVGKWHLGYRPECRPYNRGFDYYFGFLGGAHSYFQWDEKHPDNGIRRNDEVLSGSEYLTYAFNQKAAEFIRREKDRPFFLYLSYNAIHDPMHASPRHKEDFAHIQDPLRRTMAGMLAAVDDGVGELLKVLREHELEKDTLIVFLSDNGGPTRNNASRNDPLRGGKSSMWEGGIRIPFIMQWKGVLPAGKVYDKPVIAMDIAPTALAVAETTAPVSARLDGVNLVPYLTGQRKESPHERLFWRMENAHAVRVGDWKLVGIPGSKPQLFNLAEDIGESNDLAESNPDKLKELLDAWDDWDSANVEQLWLDSRDPRNRVRQDRRGRRGRNRPSASTTQ